ncbi:aminotransferase class V-fold PLP-dependent enzyme [Nonomuraea sp. NPDC051191]|uniref:aminotransferase class V-fold PLP-dependent enzyme n=1 Tax=Nonomuraea sp. NPDC051191 TaxID=3364372 RepID=UPI00379EDB8B
MNVQIFAEPSGYLDFARLGPLSRAVAGVLAESAHRRVGDMPLAWFEEQAARTRSAAARLLRAAEHEVAFVSSTSHGLFAAAAALPGEGVVLLPRGEFPANVYPWLRFEGRGGLRVRWIDEVRLTPQVLAEHLDASVRALAVSAVDALTGYPAPLGALKEVLGPGRVLVVDAIQGLGAVPLEVEAADVLVCGGQKWLRAGWGAALFLARDRVAGLMAPGLGGWSGVEGPLAGPAPRPPLAGAAAHTMTNPDYSGVAALGVAIELVLEAGVAEIGRRTADRLGELLDTARAAGARVLLDAPAGAGGPAPPGAGRGPGRGAAEWSGIGSFTMPGRDPAAVHAALAAAGLTTTLRGEWIRLSPHATTSGKAVQRLAAALHPPRKESS